MILQKLCPEIQSIEIFESKRTSRTMISLNEVRFNGVSMLRIFMQLFLLNIDPLLKSNFYPLGRLILLSHCSLDLSVRLHFNKHVEVDFTFEFFLNCYLIKFMVAYLNQ